MKLSIPVVLFIALTMLGMPSVKSENPPRFGLAVHGGAGTILKSDMSPELEAEYRAKLSEALLAGKAILEKGGTSLDAVETVVRMLEDSPLFNAGKGAVFAANGKNELDASIMDGDTRKAGAVSGVTRVRNPIGLARLVMEKSPHVMLTGRGAEEFAVLNGVRLVPEKYFFTERRWNDLQRAKEAERQAGGAKKSASLNSTPEKFGTVGAVALDLKGNLAAATSTGGMTNKKFGRVGDSPVIGAGTYADNRTCAVSATGHGEYFIRLGVARDISALIEYKGLSAREAADLVIHKKLTELGGTGGVIVIDRNGQIAMPFNTKGMYRGFLDGEGKPVVEIYSSTDTAPQPGPVTDFSGR